jgi:hypothetical protein
MNRLMRLLALVNLAAAADDGDRERAAAEDRRRANEIRIAASALRSKASKVHARASAARSEASSVRSKTSQMQSDERDAKSKRQSMEGQIHQNNMERSQLESEANSLKQAAEGQRRQKVQVDAEIAVNNRTLSELLKVVYNLEAKVKFKETERDDLETLKQQVNAIYTNMTTLSEMQARAAGELTISAEAHMAWMKHLGEVTERLAPDFKGLKSSDDVKIAAYKASAFPKEAPDPEGPNSREELAIKTERDISALTGRIQEQLRQSGSMPGLAVYHKYSQTRFDGAYWQGIDESVHKNIELALQIDALVKLSRERRGYLVRVIPVMWERMLNLRLDSIHLQMAVHTGEVALDGLSLQDLIMKAKELDIQHNQATLLFFKLYSPLMATVQINAAFELADRFNTRLAQMQQSSAVVQVRLTVEEKRKRLQSLQTQISREMSADGNTFLKNRQKSIAAIDSTNSQSAECQAWKKTVQQASADLNNEIAYNSFMRSCQ